MSFEQILPWTLKYEGGKVDDPDDAGGRTAYGITQRTFTDWLLAHNLPIRDVWTITPDERTEIYRGRYWTPVAKLGLSDPLTMAAFDFAVHSGVARAQQYLVGDVDDYLDNRLLWFEDIIRRKPRQAKYRKGWRNRVAALRAFLAGGANGRQGIKTAA